MAEADRVTRASTRIRAIDWVRGLVMMLMTVDHSGSAFDAAHMHGDNGSRWIVGSPLPAGEFLTRWITHLCAPTFVLLAGASLALSTEKRRGQAGQTRFIVTRGLFIASLDPLWMSMAFSGYHPIIFQVLYAIGFSLVCMAFLRRLSSPALFAIAIAIQLGGELSQRWMPTQPILASAWSLLFVGGRVADNWVNGYPLIPWLSVMMLGWLLGRWMLTPRPNATRARTLVAIGIGLLAAFALVRGIDGYGNWGLHRDSLAFLQWLHVAKYPPSLSFTCLELGISFVMLAAFTAIDDEKPRRLLAPLSLFGVTAFFYYIFHAHLLHLGETVFHIDRNSDGLMKTWLGAAIVIVVLAYPCWLYRRYKRSHPDGWTRYV